MYFSANCIFNVIFQDYFLHPISFDFYIFGKKNCREKYVEMLLKKLMVHTIILELKIQIIRLKSIIDIKTNDILNQLRIILTVTGNLKSPIGPLDYLKVIHVT